MSDPSRPDDGRDGSPGAPAPPRRVPGVARVARVAGGAAVTVLGAVLVWWWATGGTWLIVSTPSMGTYAPVGTLLWVRPTGIDDIRVGDVVTYRTGAGAPASLTYTHRVVARNADGTLTTRGDLNGADDPWRIHAGDLVGRVATRWWGVGWLVRALPLLILGGIVWWVITAALASRRSRAPLRIVGAAVLVATAINVYHPLFGATQLSFVPLGPPGARATYVGTGLLPLTMEAAGAPPVAVAAGEKESIVVPHPDDAGHFEVRLVPRIPWLFWVLVAAACLAPAIWSVIAGVEPPTEPSRPS